MPAFENVSDIVGVFEGGETLVSGASSAVVSKRLEWGADGTFTWTGVSFAGTTPQSSRLSAGTGDMSKGRWQWSGYLLTLTDDNGAVLRRIVFPFDDGKTAVKDDRMYFGGLMYKRQ